MKIFVSYAFNDADRWIEELVFPLINALGYEVVTGQKMEGEVLIEGVDQRLRNCAGCVAFSTRRRRREDNTYETHPWVMTEMTKARTVNLKTVEIREEGVTIGNENDAYVRIAYRASERDRMLIKLAQTLASWNRQLVRARLDPPKGAEDEFMRSVLRSGVRCTYDIQKDGQDIGRGEAKMLPITGACFIDIEIPTTDVLVQISINRQSDNAIAWKSSFIGLSGIPIQLFQL